MRDSFVIYRSMFNSLTALTPKQAMEVIRAIGEYALDDKEPSQDGIGKALFEQYKLIIDKNNKHFEAGKKGGRPPKNPKPNNNQNETKPKPNDNQNVTQKEKGERRKEKDYLSGLQPSLSDESEKGGENSTTRQDESGTDESDESGRKDKFAPKTNYPYKAVIDYLNEKTEKGYSLRSSDTREKLALRFKQGYTLDEIKKAIDNAWEAWKDTPHLRECVRPGTIFGEKFDDYLNMIPEDFRARSKEKTTKFSNYPERNNDYAAIERGLINSADKNKPPDENPAREDSG